MLDPQSSQNEILGYSSWTFAFVYSSFKILSKTFKNFLYYLLTRNKDVRP